MIHSATSIRELLGGHRFHYANEDQLQAGIAAALTAAGIAHEREVRLTAHDRIDFLVERLGIEVKVGHPLASVIRQLHRYAQCEQIDELLLITNRCNHALVPESINGKRIEVLFLGWGTLG